MIYFSKNQIAHQLADWLEQNVYRQIVVIADTNTQHYAFPKIAPVVAHSKLIVVPAGESHKNIQTCQMIWAKMTEWNLDRKALCINLGGGVVGDMGGFCAATYKRGIDFIQIPTTLLAQVDASVGGKLGVDFQGFKNQIGVFREPKAVMIDTCFLETLPPRELLSGYAEIIKHCLIADAQQWKQLTESDSIHHDWDTLVRHSVEIKKNIVQQDPEEKNIRKLLNFGHTVGHALESYFLETSRPLLHGEAIAWGMIAECYIAVEKNLLDAESLKKIQEYISRYYPAINFQEDALENIEKLAWQDKKNEQGQLNLTLLSSIGTGIINVNTSSEEVKRALAYLKTIS
jgi:3-dehydroquinate synthase